MVYVINKDDKALMPCSACKARKLLISKKAIVIQKYPFIIKLIYGSTGHKQEIVAGLDTGSKVLGCAAISNNQVIYQSEVTLRNNISEKLTQRLTFRRNRRNRKTRYRKIRISNRKSSKKEGWLPPSLKSKINSHLKEIKFVNFILPVKKWIFELASFDIHKIINPTVSGINYQNGKLKDFYNIKQYVLSRDGYKCQSKQKTKHSKKLHIHHIHFKSQGGSDNPENLITLCEQCHESLHKNIFQINTRTKSKNTKHANHSGIIKKNLEKSNIKHNITFGYETKFKREFILNLKKTHANDAIAICFNEISTIKTMNTIFIKKHISKGDYKQTVGNHSQTKIPTGKLFGFRKGDKVLTHRGIGFIKGKRTTGDFAISNLDGNQIYGGVSFKKIQKINSRKTVQIEVLTLKELYARRNIH